MSFPKAWIVTVAAMNLTGCSTLTDWVSGGVNQNTGVPLYWPDSTEESLQRTTRAFQEATISDVHKIVSYLQRDGLPGMGVRYTRVSNGMDIQFEYATVRGYFPPGEYAVEQIKRTEDRGVLIFSAIVLNTTRKIIESAEKVGLGVVLDAEYSAQADGLPIRHVLYRGEFGETVTFPAAATKLNGAPTDISIKSGQAISNAELAALRAASLRWLFHGYIRAYEIRDRYVLTTVDAIGIEARWVKLRVTIRPKRGS